MEFNLQPKLGTAISKCTIPEEDIISCCERIRFEPAYHTLSTLCKYGDIVIGDCHILGFNSKSDESSEFMIEGATKYAQSKGLPDGYIVVRRLALPHCGSYGAIVMDKYSDLYVYMFRNQELRDMEKSLSEYIIESFSIWIHKHF